MTNEDTLSMSIETFLLSNFPQIQMHGGDITIEAVHPDREHAEIRLTDACDGCGLSPMTIDAIKRRLPQDVDGITTVDVATGPAPDETPDAPY